MSDPLRVQMSGAASAFAAGFVRELLERGLLAGHRGPAVAADGAPQPLNGGPESQAVHLRREEIERFVHERRAEGQVQLASTRALVPLLGHLRGLGVSPIGESHEAPTMAGALLDRYAEYLVGRGLAAETVRCHCNTARAFPADRERAQASGDLALEALDGAAINDYLLRYSRRYSGLSAIATVTGLRSFC